MVKKKRRVIVKRLSRADAEKIAKNLTELAILLEMYHNQIHLKDLIHHLRKIERA